MFRYSSFCFFSIIDVTGYQYGVTDTDNNLPILIESGIIGADFWYVLELIAVGEILIINSTIAYKYIYKNV